MWNSSAYEVYVPVTFGPMANEISYSPPQEEYYQYWIPVYTYSSPEPSHVLYQTHVTAVMAPAPIDQVPIDSSSEHLSPYDPFADAEYIGEPYEAVSEWSDSVERSDINSPLANDTVISEDHKTYFCNHCDEVFLTSEEREMHLELLKKERPHACDKCGKRFRTSEHLRRHFWSHNGPMKHECTECGKKFRRKDNLRTHMRLHTGERPYKCEHCPRTFRHYSSLKSHIRTHTEEVIMCKLCRKDFSSKAALKKHMKRKHHAERITDSQAC